MTLLPIVTPGAPAGATIPPDTGGVAFSLASLGIVQSMNRPGKMNDNVHIESFFHSMKSDVVHGVRFDHDQQITAELTNYMPFYNHRRLHSSLGYVPPATYEQQSA